MSSLKECNTRQEKEGKPKLLQPGWDAEGFAASRQAEESRFLLNYAICCEVREPSCKRMLRPERAACKGGGGSGRENLASFLLGYLFSLNSWILLFRSPALPLRIFWERNRNVPITRSVGDPQSEGRRRELTPLPPSSFFKKKKKKQRSSCWKQSPNLGKQIFCVSLTKREGEGEREREINILYKPARVRRDYQLREICWSIISLFMRVVHYHILRKNTLLVFYDS